MDVAYDHIQEEILTSNNNNSNSNNNKSSPNGETASEGPPAAGGEQRPPLDLSSEFQETFRAFSNSPWGARLGGLWGNARKQGETYYNGAREEYNLASEEAVKGFTGLRDTIVGRTRGLSLGGLTGEQSGNNETADQDGGPVTPTSSTTVKPEGSSKAAGQETDEEGFIARFRAEAAKRLKDIEKAEDAADEALLRFGTNISNFLRDAVSIAPPDATGNASSNKVLFESKDMDGKRVIHTTRFDAQLHAVHANLEGLSTDPLSDEWTKWKDGFKVDSKTDDIAADLETYPELRRAMESLVPEKVEYADFWTRYYFLRMVIESEEKRRKELLKASADDEEEVAWDEDSDSEPDAPLTPQVKITKNKHDASQPSLSSSTSLLSGSCSTLPGRDSDNMLKPSEPRRSNDQQSQADSDASYDLVSGATSRAPGSPKEEKASPAAQVAAKADDDSDEDWE
ncbi:hypothetical protein AJ80_00522 [Polytolypa hystricis UAMH7299]|uniref:BSD domain-containing protein n=1 Tax=Polytolypa hystricis (strain UAMH7299) TaxID=1447883 RepID=A0A2B7Z293_POLH7|nr:hypothetical protein AJ80_00522 [Polytolypa hystricis UAMH7299]